MASLYLGTSGGPTDGAASKREVLALSVAASRAADALEEEEA